MRDLSDLWPLYGFAEHKGYSTPEHSAALQLHGPCPEHRMSYANVAAAGAAVGEVSVGRGTVGVASDGQEAWSVPMGENGDTNDGGRVGVR
jgi:ribonuclease HII